MTYRLHFDQGTHASIKSDIAAIQHLLTCNGINTKIKSDQVAIRKIIKTAEREFPSKSQKSEALTVRQIKHMLELVQPISIDACIIRSIITVAFATGLRGTEFLPQKQKLSRKEKMFLLRKDRLFLWESTDNSDTAHFGVIWFFKSKTNQKLEQEFATLPCSCNIGFCPIVELLRLNKLYKNLKQHSVLFTWANGDFCVKHQFRTILKNLAAEIGINPKQVGNHSTRKACILHAIQHGLPDSVIVQLGRWHSFHSIRPYINMSPLALVNYRNNTQTNTNDNMTDKHRFRLLSRSKPFN